MKRLRQTKLAVARKLAIIRTRRWTPPSSTGRRRRLLRSTHMVITAFPSHDWKGRERDSSILELENYIITARSLDKDALMYCPVHRTESLIRMQSLAIYLTAMSAFWFLVHTSSWEPKRPWSAGALYCTKCVSTHTLL